MLAVSFGISDRLGLEQHPDFGEALKYYSQLAEPYVETINISIYGSGYVP